MTWPEMEGRGVENMEKYFFAFLDELDHLEAEKKKYPYYLILI